MADVPISPVVQGLTSAMSLADLLHRQRIQDQQIALTRQRMADEERVNAGIAERANADLSMRLNAMGARQMTPSDELEASTGTRVDFTPRRSTVTAGDGLPDQRLDPMPAFSQSDIKSRLVKAGGQQWVLPTEQDRIAREDRASDREMKRDVAKTEATTAARLRVERAGQQAKIDTDLAGKQANLDKFGITISDENAALLGLPKGTRILEEHLDDYTRSIASMKAAKLQEGRDVRMAVPMYGETESGVAVVMNDGTVKWTPVQIGPQRKAPQSGNTARIAEQDATKRLVEETASQYATKYDDPAAAEAALKADSATDNFVKKNYLSILKNLRTAAPKPKNVNNMTPEELIDQLNGAIDGDKSAAPNAARGNNRGNRKPSKGKADGAKVRAYAQRYKIPYDEAVKQAEKEGFDVTGLRAR